jgi:hypothetical protein
MNIKKLEFPEGGAPAEYVTTSFGSLVVPVWSAK